MLGIGLIGCGACARIVLRGIHDGLAGDVRVAAIYVRDPARVECDVAPGATVTSQFEEFLGQPASLVVEIAGQAAVRDYGESILEAGKDMLVLSVGAFADDDLRTRLCAAAERSGRRIHAPSGAIGALDAISAAMVAGLDEVTITTRKPAKAWAGGPDADEQLAAATEPILLYDGPAREAIARYPSNVNVAAALSLCGIGFDRTRIRIYADPSVERNTHEIRASGAFGDLQFKVENVPSENPRTSRLAALSVLKTLRSLQAPLVVG